MKLFHVDISNNCRNLQTYSKGKHFPVKFAIKKKYFEIQANRDY